VERLLMADLDGKVCDFCREHMPEWNEGVWDDPRFECVYEDAKVRLETCAAAGEKFDVIIMDICDPLDAGPGWMLYTKEFYETARDKYLTPGGVIVTQSTSMDPGAPGSPENDDPFCMLNGTLKAAFGTCIPYHAQIPSFYYPWGFNMACADAKRLLTADVDVKTLDARLQERLGKDAAKLRHYDGTTHRHAFSLPKGTRARLAKETRIFTLAQPLFCKRE
jgi:spermidine synthase